MRSDYVQRLAHVLRSISSLIQKIQVIPGSRAWSTRSSSLPHKDMEFCSESDFIEAMKRNAIYRKTGEVSILACLLISWSQMLPTPQHVVYLLGHPSK